MSSGNVKRGITRHPGQIDGVESAITDYSIGYLIVAGGGGGGDTAGIDDRGGGGGAGGLLYDSD